MKQDHIDALNELAFQKGDHTEIKKRLMAKGYRPSLLLKGPFEPIKMCCDAGGRGVNCQHTWITTPMEALTEEGGCPWCKLEDHIKNGKPEEVSEAELVAAIKKQHKALSDSINRAKRRSNRFSGNNHGVERYSI